MARPEAPHPSALDSMEPMSEQRRPKLRDAVGVDPGVCEDRLSPLPDDILIHILLKLQDAPVAGRTSVLARRWRRVWALLPELHFPDGTGPDRIPAALAAHDAPVLGRLFVAANEATLESVGAWLSVAARRLSGVLHFNNWRYLDTSYLKLPCFQNAIEIKLDLNFTGLALPPSGLFTRLTDLDLRLIKLHGPCSLSDVVSSPRCPSLRRLSICYVRGMDELTIHSESLLHLKLGYVPSLQQLNVIAVALQKLSVKYCFTGPLNQGQPVANISAPQLVTLRWSSGYDPSSVMFGDMPHLQQLTANPLAVYGQDAVSAYNRHCLMLLQHFDHISRLNLILIYRKVKGDDRFLMQEMTKFPNITILALTVVACEHSFGASSFHVLRMSSGIRELELKLLDTPKDMEVAVCQSGCICDQPSIWETEELVLHCLEEVTIDGMRGTEHQLALVKRLFKWTTRLKGMTVNFHSTTNESKCEELCKSLISFSKPGICMKFLHLGKACSSD